MNVKSVLKIHFPRRYVAAGEKKRSLLFSVELPGVVNPEPRDRKWLEDYTTWISDYNVWLINVNPCRALVFQHEQKNLGERPGSSARFRNGGKYRRKRREGAIYTWHCGPIPFRGSTFVLYIAAYNNCDPLSVFIVEAAALNPIKREESMMKGDTDEPFIDF